MNLYKVETLVQFKHTYFIRAEALEHAMDEVVCNQNIEEATQEFLGDVILGGREVTMSEFNSYIEQEKNREDSGCSWWIGANLINDVDYGSDTIKVSVPVTPGQQAFDTMVSTLTSTPTDTITVTPHQRSLF